MKFWKKAASAVLAAFLCLSAVSCGDTSWAMKVDGETLPAGIYIVNQYQAFQNAYSHEDFDMEQKDIWDNKLDDKSLSTWINDEASQLTKEYVVIEKMFEEMGLSLDEEDMETIDYSVEQGWSQMKDYFNKLGVAESSYEAVVTNSLKEQKVFEAYYSAGGAEPVDDALLQEEFETNYAQIHMITFSLLDSTGTALDEEKKAAAKATADNYLQRAQDGEDMVTLIRDYTKETAQANEEDVPSDDSINVDTMTIKKGVVDIYNYVPETINTAIFETAQIGEPILLEDDNAYYLVLKYDLSRDPAAFEEMRGTLLSDMKGDSFQQVLEQKADELSVEYNDTAIKAFKPEKLEAK